MDNELFVKGWRVGVQGWVWGGDGGWGVATQEKGTNSCCASELRSCVKVEVAVLGFRL